MSNVRVVKGLHYYGTQKGGNNLLYVLVIISDIAIEIRWVYRVIISGGRWNMVCV